MYCFFHLGLITEADDYDVRDPLVNGEDIPLETAKSLDNWQVPKENVTEISILGHGKMGRVFKAIAITEKNPDGALVSVKEFGSIENQQKEEFNLEVEMFLQLNHENVVKLIGVASLNSPYYMMIEYSELVKINLDGVMPEIVLRLQILVITGGFEMRISYLQCSYLTSCDI